MISKLSTYSYVAFQSGSSYSSMNQYFTLWVLEWNIGGKELAVYFVYLPKQELIQLVSIQEEE